MSSKSLSNLSAELLESIVSEIDLPKDLLHLALVSKPLKTIIIPNHIQLRRIRCHAYQNDFFKILIDKPILAVNIRALEIGFGPYTSIHKEQIVPPMFEASLEDPTTKPVEEFLLFPALNKMKRLTKFGVNATMETAVEGEVMRGVLSSVGNGPFCLEELSLWYNSMNKTSHVGDDGTTPYLVRMRFTHSTERSLIIIPGVTTTQPYCLIPRRLPMHILLS